MWMISGKKLFAIMVIISIFVCTGQTFLIVQASYLGEKHSMKITSTTQSTKLTLNSYQTSKENITPEKIEDFYISLNFGEYLIHVQEEQKQIMDLDLVLTLAYDELFSNIIATVDGHGSDIGFERYIISIFSLTTVYIRVSCNANNGWFNIVVSDNMNEGFVRLDVDSGICGVPPCYLYPNEYEYYYCVIPPGEVQLTVKPDNMNTEVILYSDPLVQNVYTEVEALGSVKTINFGFTESTIVYLKVFLKSVSSYYTITLSKVFHTLTLNQVFDGRNLKAGEAHDYAIGLPAGKFLIHAETVSNMDLTITAALDDQFSNLILSSNNFGVKENEKCVINLLGSAAVYIRISCAQGEGSYNVILSDDINAGYAPLIVDYRISNHVEAGESQIYYFDFNGGEISFEAIPASSLDLELSVSFDPLVLVIDTLIDSYGLSESETVSFKFNEQVTLYVKVRAKTGSGDYSLLASKVFKPLVFNEESKDLNLQTGELREFNISLPAGTYLVFVEPTTLEFDIEIEIALDSTFSDVIFSIDNLGSGGDERGIIDLSSLDTLYIRVLAVEGSGFYNIIVTDDVNLGYLPITTDVMVSDQTISEGEYVIYYAQISAGKIEVTLNPSMTTDLLLELSSDPLLTEIDRSSDNIGYGEKEVITFTSAETAYVYIKVKCTLGSGKYSLLVSKISSITDTSKTTDITGTGDTSLSKSTTPPADGQPSPGFSFLGILIPLVISYLFYRKTRIDQA